MIKAVIVLGLVAIASAQVLRISPHLFGSSSPAQLQVIHLGNGGAVAPIGRIQAVPVAIRPVQPIQLQLQPVPIRPVQVQPIQVRPIAIQAAPAPAKEEAPQPYGFAFDSEDEFGTKIGRQESGNEQGVITGSYTLSDANGISRIVTYVADDDGFRATVKTNEPGTLTSNPADVSIESTASARK